jgi:hypothetical protein
MRLQFLLAVLFATLLAFALTLSFLSSHHSLHVAISNDRQYKFHSDRAGDWQAVYNLARLAKDRNEFLSLLKAEGWLVTHDERNEAQMQRVQVERDHDTEEVVVSKQEEARKASSTDDYDDMNQIDQGPRDIIISEAEEEAEEKKRRDEEVTAKRSSVSLKPAASVTMPTTKRTMPAALDDAEANKASSLNDPPPLTVQVARKASVERSIIVTWANMALLDFVLSWAHHVDRLGIKNILVGAMDQDIGRELVKEGINSFAMYELKKKNGTVGSDHLAWGGEGFHKMGRLKIGLAQTFLSYELNLLLVDVDVMILRNVMKYFDQLPEADILVSSDNLDSTTEPGDDGLEFPEKAGAPMNIGIMYFRWSENTVRFVSSWLNLIVKKTELWDQLAFNDLARAGWDPYVKLHPNNKRVFLGYNGTVYVGVLPVALFAGGHNFYIQRLHEVQMVEPYAVHATFQYGGNIGKRNRMREAMIFEDNSTYYGLGSQEKFIMVDLEKSPSLSAKLFSSTMNYTQKKVYNMEGLDMQLQSVWPGIALSHLFSRTFIVPKFTCYCDRYWMPLDDCRIPGALKQRLPFECPMDYVLDPIGLTDDASPEFIISWRENSFLINPRCPDSVKRSKLTVYTAKDSLEVSERYSMQDGGLVIVLPEDITTNELRNKLAPYNDYKIWHFKTPSKVFKGFEDRETTEAFIRRKDRLKPITQPLNETVASSG